LLEGAAVAHARAVGRLRATSVVWAHRSASGVAGRCLLLAGASTAVCIDSTARSGYELGYDIIVLDDCNISRTPAEQEMYCTNIFPIYASVTSSTQWLNDHALASGSA